MYELFEEVDGKDCGEPSFTLLEWWDSIENLPAHMATPHVKAILPKVMDLLGTEPDIKKVQVTRHVTNYLSMH